MKYELIIFDADETLFDFNKSEKEAFKNTMLECHIDYDEDYHFKLYHDINLAVWKELEKGLITQEALKVERFKRLSDTLNIQFDNTQLAKAYMNHLANSSVLYDGSIELVDALSKHYLLVIVTNGLKHVQNLRIRNSAIAKYFKDIIISEEVGASKPNPKIFEHTLRNIGAIAKLKILVVGDSLTADIQGGINFGVDTCWYNPNRTTNETAITPTYEVADFKALRDLLL
ncbi:YjjG family noncanonical pyrimidine nucleotidase [Cellulosilyticum sp. I15G10I2]|uniref:YjjG family noncanonical pyrimidine nucleotidase n=1 Tax=Cellulosilyticum sp. I15G10I2 TaxID=1892843 RepID=UPI00085C3065|nr:YjjG family noncanonical pyrimidine nucleotidase [Cellulosilyticum sp. I15G10I2]